MRHHRTSASSYIQLLADLLNWPKLTDRGLQQWQIVPVPILLTGKCKLSLRRTGSSFTERFLGVYAVISKCSWLLWYCMLRHNFIVITSSSFQPIKHQPPISFTWNKAMQKHWEFTRKQRGDQARGRNMTFLHEVK